MSAVIVLDEIPGMAEALRAVQLIGGVLLDPRAAQQIVVAAWAAAEPAARSAAFADAADVLTEFASDPGLGYLADAAVLLDLMSYETRGYC
jgi:hypothetical protein